MQLQIQLLDHVGKKFSRRLGIEVDVVFDQYKIVIGGEDYKKATGRDNVHIGYVGKRPGMPINWLPAANEFPENVRAKMAENVQVELARKADASDQDKEMVVSGQTRPVNDPPPMPGDTVSSVASPADADDENL